MLTRTELEMMRDIFERETGIKANSSKQNNRNKRRWKNNRQRMHI